MDPRQIAKNLGLPTPGNPAAALGPNGQGPGQMRQGGQGGASKRIRLDMSGSKRGLGGLRRKVHNKYRKEGKQWRPVGVAVVTNSTGTDQLVWLSSGTATQGSATRLNNPVYKARLVIQNDGGSCDRMANIQPNGQVLYTGNSPVPSAHVLVGKGTAVVDPMDKDVGLPVGDVEQTFDMQLWLANGDTAIVALNGYTSIALADVDNDDDAPGDDDDDAAE